MGVYKKDSPVAEVHFGIAGGVADIQEIYLGSTRVRPKGWQPGENTLLYMPYSSDLLDHSGNNITFTTGGSGLSIVDGTAYFNGGYQYRNSGIGLTSLPATVSVWVKPTVRNETEHDIVNMNNQSGGYYGWNIILTNSSGDKFRSEVLSGGQIFSGTISLNNWYLLTLTMVSGTATFYLNGTKISTSSCNPTFQNKIGIGTNYWTDGYLGQNLFKGYMSDLIIENKARTETEISEYYDNAKSNYGL